MILPANPSTVLVTEIAGEMGDALNAPPLNMGRDFFSAGGDSLRAIQLISRLVTRYGYGEEAPDEALRANLIMAIFGGADSRSLASVIEGHRR